jgi:hypothetical protein
MADNIKIVGQVLDTNRVNRYDIQDEQLLNPIVQQETFGQPEDYVEYFVFDLGGNILNSNYNYTSYKLPSDYAYSQSYLPTLEIDPIQDIENLGYESGEVTSRYNFFRKISGEPFSTQLFISQISSDRTELRVDSTELSDVALIDIASNFADKQLAVPYYYYVILNFGNNNQVVAVNILSEINALGEASILFKLYEPLPANLTLKDKFWIVEEIVSPYIYDLSLDKIITPLPQPYLKGPNFSIDLEFKNVVPTQYSNLSQLVTSLTGSSYQAALNSLTNQEVNINVDYSLLNDFIHYSSAANRINNFIFKVGEIEGYQYEISTFSPLTASNASLINQVNQASSSLNATIAGFDGFESYLYYNSSSLTSSIVQYNLETGSYLAYNIAPYPKSNLTQPYVLYPSSSATVTSWYDDAIEVADAYDVLNKDILTNTIPSYIQDDPDNYLPYIVFVNMIGQYFDNIWVYIDKMTDVWDNNNNLNEGISQDLVYDWLRSFGMKLYNSQGDQTVLDYNVGGFSGSVDFAPNCRRYQFTNITSFTLNQTWANCDGTPGSANVPGFFDSKVVCAISGSYVPLTPGITVNDLGPCYDGNYSPSSSFLNNIPRKDLVLDTYKRLYHNLPYLFKGKGAHGGLQGLITLFGITGSILPIKEYGGTNDYQDLKGYTVDKISLGSNNLTGSVLSPIKRFETPTTSSREIKSQDLHFIDVSFSPQTQIDNEVSASITAVNPNWVIDDYIAYPDALYLDTYPSLSFQRDYWFGQTFTHPNEGFDYGGFIRLIQFFDNSLFKMVQDFTPARGNTWTGVSIKSPVLERPKVPEARPIFTNFPDLEGSVTGAALIPLYDPYYFYLAGDKEPYYTGNITGSFIDTYAYFEENNINPYLVNNTVGYIPPGFVSGNTDFILNIDEPAYENFFINSDFNALQNNEFVSLTSQYRKKLIPILSTDSLGRTFTSYSITGAVELQDSYLSDTSYVNARYDGVQLYGTFYNIYTDGDISYGLTPVINHNTKKLGLFTEIVDSVLPYKSNVTLKYLVDETGKLTELNQRNRNWFEVQNTFETGDTLNVSLLNTQQYSNQYATNGNKLIYESGYAYFPILYYYGSSSLTASQYIPFSTSTSDLGLLASNYFETYPSGGKFIPATNYTSASSPVYSGWYEVWNLFDTTGSSGVIPNGSYGTLTIPPSQLGNQFFTGSGPGVIDVNGVNVTSSYYIVPFPGAYDFYHNFDLNVLGGVGATFTGSMEIWVSSSYNGSFQKKTAISQSIQITQGVWNGLLSQQQQWGPNATIQPSATSNNPSDNLYGSTTRIIYNGYQLYEFAGAGANCGDTPGYITDIVGDTTFQKFDVFEPLFFNTTPVYKASVWIDITNNTYYNINQYWNTIGIRKYADLVPCNNPQDISLRFTNSFLYDTNQNSSYKAGDKVVFRFFIKTTSNGSNQIDSGSLRSYIDTVANPYGVSSIYNFINYTAGILQVSPNAQSQLATASICNDQINSAFIMGSQLSGFYDPNYIFNPLASDYSSSYAPLYQEYGYVGYPFQLEPYDKILIQVENESGFIFEYNISQVAIDGAGRLNVQIFENLNGYFADGFCNTFYKIVFLKRVPDETSVILSTVKPPGKTSYGFIIPQNISQDVINNIDNITKNVKLQLLDAGSNVIV